MSSSELPNPRNDAYWRDYLSSGDSRERSLRRALNLIPGEPRCRLRAAPFAGAAAPFMRLFGKRPSDMAAGTGQILVSESTATAAGLGAGLARRQLELKGKSAPTDVVVLQVGAR